MNSQHQSDTLAREPGLRPMPSILTAEQRDGDPETYKSEVLHSEPDGGFSIVALVWLQPSRSVA
jgi:hypothetical protein